MVTQKQAKSSCYLDKHAHTELIQLSLKFKVSKGNSLLELKNSSQNHNNSFIQ